MLGGVVYGVLGFAAPPNGTDLNGIVFALTPPASGTTYTQATISSFSGGTTGGKPGGRAARRCQRQSVWCGLQRRIHGRGLQSRRRARLRPDLRADEIRYYMDAHRDLHVHGRQGWHRPRRQPDFGLHRRALRRYRRWRCAPTLYYPIGCGTVFKLTPPASGTAWTETILYNVPGRAPPMAPSRWAQLPVTQPATFTALTAVWRHRGATLRHAAQRRR